MRVSSSTFLFRGNVTLVLLVESLFFVEGKVAECKVNCSSSAGFNGTIYLAESGSMGSPPGYAGICGNNFVEKKTTEIISNRYLSERFFMDGLVLL